MSSVVGLGMMGGFLFIIFYTIIVLCDRSNSEIKLQV